jgi:hypothetical protein
VGANHGQLQLGNLPQEPLEPSMFRYARPNLFLEIQRDVNSASLAHLLKRDVPVPRCLLAQGSSQWRAAGD